MLCVVLLPEPDAYTQEPREDVLEKLYQWLWPLLTIICVPQVQGGVELIRQLL